jgi:hypothetical protein
MLAIQAIARSEQLARAAALALDKTNSGYKSNNLESTSPPQEASSLYKPLVDSRTIKQNTYKKDT